MIWLSPVLLPISERAQRNAKLLGKRFLAQAQRGSALVVIPTGVEPVLPD